MLVLFDNGAPRTLARYLIDRHTVTEARARGWEQLENGALLAAAEAECIRSSGRGCHSEVPVKPASVFFSSRVGPRNLLRCCRGFMRMPARTLPKP